MHHILGQNPLPFDPNSMQVSSSIQHQQKQYNTGGLAGPMMSDTNNFLSSSHHQHHQQHLASYNHHHHHHHHHNLQQYCPPPPPPPPSIQQQFNNYHYMNTYSQDTSNVYNPDSQLHFPNHHFDPQQTYSSYDSNNNYGDQQQYGLLRPAIESELYSSYYTNDIEQNSSTANENLLHNLNNNNNTNNNPIPHYTDLTAITNNNKHYDFVGTNDLDNHHKDDEQSTLPLSNENNFHWNQTTCLAATQW